MEELARWDHEHIAGLLETCTGAQWLRVARIIRENEVHGRDLAAHIEPDNPGKLVTFFLEDFGESITKFIAKQFVSKLIQASSAGRKEGKRPANDQRESRGQLPDDTPQVGAADGGGTGTARVPTCILNVDFNASAAESAHVSSRRLMVEVPISASVALVKRRLLDALHLPLFSSLKLVKSGVELKDTEDSVRPNWPSFSFVHAILLPAVIPLSSDNLGTHACVVQHVALSQKSMATAMSDTNTLSNNLVLFINEGTNPLGNGAAGVTYKGSVIDKANPNEKITVAVKRFFILENPKFYGLSKAADVAAWADRELYSEINTLLSLSHPSVVRLRCVGLLSIYDKPFPAYIAMDFCNAGSLDQWIKEKRVSALQLVPFLQQFVDAMTYLHVDMKIVHRDIKPDNVFLHKRAPDAQPVLVVGDVGLAKHITATLAKVSAGGAVAYMAPEVPFSRNGECSLASDVFSVSLVMVEMVCLEFAWTREQGRDDTARRRCLMQRANEKMQRVLQFAGSQSQTSGSPARHHHSHGMHEVWLTMDIVTQLTAACTKDNPDERCTFAEIAALRANETVSNVPSAAQAEESVPVGAESAHGSNTNDDGVSTVLAHMTSSELKTLVKREIDALTRLGAPGKHQSDQFRIGLQAVLTKADLISLAAACVYSARDREQLLACEDSDDDTAVRAAVVAAEQREQDEATALKFLAEELDAQEVRSVASYDCSADLDGFGGAGAAASHGNTQNLNEPMVGIDPLWDAKTGAFYCYRSFDGRMCSPQAPWQCHNCLKCMPPVAEQVVLHLPCPQCGCSMSKSRFAEGFYHGGWRCDSCAVTGAPGSQRWFCKSCQKADICFSCGPNLKSATAVAVPTAKGQTASAFVEPPSRSASSHLSVQKVTVVPRANHPRHPLHQHAVNPTSGRFMCDVCQSTVNGGTGLGTARYRCTSGCDWDVCGPCMYAAVEQGTVRNISQQLQNDTLEWARQLHQKPRQRGIGRAVVKAVARAVPLALDQLAKYAIPNRNKRPKCNAETGVGRPCKNYADSCPHHSKTGNN